MMLDVSNVRTFLRLNGLSETSPETEIRNLLSAAHYSDTEITAFLDEIRDPDAAWLPPRPEGAPAAPEHARPAAQPSPAVHPLPPPAPKEPEYTVPTYKLPTPDPVQIAAASVHAEKIVNRFQGRVSRKNYALGTVALFGASILMLVLEQALKNIPFLMILICVPIIGIAALIGISLNMRRLHDLGHPGGMVIIMIVPYVNLFFLLYLLIKKGEPKENAYGKPAQEVRFMRALLAAP